LFESIIFFRCGGEREFLPVVFRNPPFDVAVPVLPSSSEDDRFDFDFIFRYNFMNSSAFFTEIGSPELVGGLKLCLLCEANRVLWKSLSKFILYGAKLARLGKEGCNYTDAEFSLMNFEHF